MMNKKGLFKEAFFAVVIMGVLITATGVIINEWNEDYSSGLTYDLEDYDKLEEISGTAQEQQGQVNIKSSTFGDLDFEGTSIRGVFGILNNIYAPFRVVFGDGGMLDSITERLGMPDYLRQAIVTLMVMSITFGLVVIFFRLPRRSA